MQLSELRLAQQRLRLVEKILCIGQASKRQRLPERQDDARFIEQAADQRRTYVPGVEDEVHRPRIAHATSRLGYARQRRPPALRSGRQNSIIQEAGGPVGAPIELHEQKRFAHGIEFLDVDVRRRSQAA